MLAHITNLLERLASWAQLWEIFWETEKFNFASASPDMPGTEDGP